MKKGLLIGAGVVASLAAVAGIGFGASKLMEGCGPIASGNDIDDDILDEEIYDEDEEVIDEIEAEDAEDDGVTVVEF